jgi:hypothetical protein
MLNATNEYEVTMRIITAISITCLVLEGSSAQTVYPVPADSKGNQIVLTIANESKT